MPSPKDPNKYLGPNVYTGSRVSRNRQPTLADYKQPETGNLYEIGCIWQVGPNPTTGVFGQLYMLQKIVANQGYWILLSTGVLPVGPVTTLSDTAGTLVMPTVGGNIQLFGGSGITVTSDPMNNKLTFALPGGGIATTEFTTDIAGPVVPTGSGVIDITGDYHANTGVPLLTDGTTANTIVISSQITKTSLASSITSNGIAHFDSTIFTADADGFVSLVGGAVPPAQKFNVDASTPPGTDPVLPSATGEVTVTGAQVANGVVGANVIRTNSTAANAFNIEIQRTTTAAAPTSADNGVSHFDSSIFTADSNGFVSLVGGAIPPSQKFDVDAHTAPGTDPVVPTSGGVVTITGAQVATGTVGTNVIRTNSLAANSMTIEVQRSTAVAATDVTKNGVCHFDSSQFSVDGNGFVTSIGPGSAFSKITVQKFTSTGAFTYTPTAGMKYVIVELVGAGAGSAGCQGGGGLFTAVGGGGAGGYAKFILTAAQVGASLSGSVGTGGAGGAAGGTTGSNGGNTTLATAAAWTAGGGLAWTFPGTSGGPTGYDGGAGGTVTTGTGSIVYTNTGQNGDPGAGVNPITISGTGGQTIFGAGGKGRASSVPASFAGENGKGYGCAAGGGYSNNSGNVAGGTGANGAAIFTEFS